MSHPSAKELVSKWSTLGKKKKKSTWLKAANFDCLKKQLKTHIEDQKCVCVNDDWSTQQTLLIDGK